MTDFEKSQIHEVCGKQCGDFPKLLNLPKISKSGTRGKNLQKRTRESAKVTAALLFDSCDRVVAARLVSESDERGTRRFFLFFHWRVPQLTEAEVAAFKTFLPGLS